MKPEEINKIIKREKENDDNWSAKDISDGWHSFGELYHGRMIMSAVIYNANSHLAWKSMLHDDGTMFDESFIVGIETPEGPYTNHYRTKHWDLFDLAVLDRAPPFDGHTAKDIGRLLSILDK